MQVIKSDKKVLSVETADDGEEVDAPRGKENGGGESYVIIMGILLHCSLQRYVGVSEGDLAEGRGEK